MSGERVPRRGRASAGEVFREVERLLEAGDASGALRALDACRLRDPLVQNARGVCLMRLGRADAAVEVFRELLVDEGSIQVREGAPATFVTNFAAALLLAGNLSGCLTLLHDLGGAESAPARKLKDAIDLHRRGMGWWERLLYALYRDTSRPVAVDGPLGEILLPPGEAGAVAPTPVPLLPH